MSADALCYPTFDASGVGALQRATGMPCIAAALVLAGGALAKGLLFVTAAPT
jgi:hypothetical protein